jgi:2-oxoglutarate/2-oxoacid ferredoxin oxidoreductase subunit beta
MESPMVTLKDFHSDDPIAWCPGCGNFAILKALKQAFVRLKKHPHEIAIVSGIGQAPKTPHYLRCNAFNGLHGRTLPVATGIKLANHELTVLAQGGDGDGYGEGGNHLLHTMRRNIDITYLVHDNRVYGLTKGQTSPTSDTGFVTQTTPLGSRNRPLNPLVLAIAMDCSFVARGFSGDMDHLTGLIASAVSHRGFALIDILQPCVTFNRVNTFKWYSDRVYRIEKESGYDPTNRLAAFERAGEWGNRIPTGILYQNRQPSLNEQLPALAETSLVKQEVSPTDYLEVFDGFR